jgi:hypothetical protein
MALAACWRACKRNQRRPINPTLAIRPVDGRFWGKADDGWPTHPAGSVENDPKRTWPTGPPAETAKVADSYDHLKTEACVDPNQDSGFEV